MDNPRQTINNYRRINYIHLFITIFFGLILIALSIFLFVEFTQNHQKINLIANQILHTLERGNHILDSIPDSTIKYFSNDGSCFRDYLLDK